MATLLSDVINAFEQIILEVVDVKANSFKLVEGGSPWAQDLFPLSVNQQAFIISDDVPFLNDFLIDAKLLWNKPDNARLRSGIWTEVTYNKKELHLEAIAIKQNQRRLLVVSNQAEEYCMRQDTLQSARELLLFYDNVLEQNEYLHTRLLDILKTPKEQDNILNTLTQAVEKAGFAVLIANNDFVTVIANSAAEYLFEQSNPLPNDINKPLDIIIKLLKNQLPEYERIISTKSTWEGELCWMSPPSTLKWLKVSLNPVTNEFNQVKNWIIFANDISNVKHLAQRNEQLALQDMLTELPNRLSFWQMLEKKVSSQEPFYLLYVDINNFRQHNEFYGHDEGDKLLVEFAGRIKRAVKESDFIARIGGDEFGIILTHVDNQQHCKKIVNRIFDGTLKPFVTGKSESFSITASVGAANFPHDASNAEELMKFVDLSTYNGKQNNKNSLQFYTESIKDASHQVIEMEHELKLAIENNEFELFLQPIINLAHKKVIKAEALIRWHHPKKGIINPGEFIPIAEKSELIITIGKWVIAYACQLVKKLLSKGHQIKVSINLSPLQVLDQSLFSYIHACVTKNNIDPQYLELEVTEGVLVDDYSQAEKLLSRARAIGMSVAVDDFGTGYSSLVYLKKLPLDFIKIDASFVQDIISNDNDKAIVKAVIAMAHNLNLGVTAEGVETQEQLNFLAKNSCDAIQGFLFSEAVNLEAFMQLLNQGNLGASWDFCK